MREFLEIVAAIAIATVLGFGVKRLLSVAAPKPTAPVNIDNEVWQQIFQESGGGGWIGAGERYLSLAAFWTANHSLIAGWFAFKLASKWEVWKNIVQVPSALEEFPPLQWFHIRRLLSSWILTRFWIGTLVNVLLSPA